MCDQCWGQGCPNCWPPLKECERCNGKGWIYFITDPDTGEEYECSEAEFDNAVEDYRREEICPECGGQGEWEEE